MFLGPLVAFPSLGQVWKEMNCLPIVAHIRCIVGTPVLIFADTLPVQIRGMEIVPWMSEYNRGSKHNVASNHWSKQKPLRSAGKANKLKEDEETSGEQVGDGQLVEDAESRPAGWAQKAHYSWKEPTHAQVFQSFTAPLNLVQFPEVPHAEEY